MVDWHPSSHPAAGASAVMCQAARVGPQDPPIPCCPAVCRLFVGQHGAARGGQFGSSLCNKQPGVGALACRAICLEAQAVPATDLAAQHLDHNLAARAGVGAQPCGKRLQPLIREAKHVVRIRGPAPLFPLQGGCALPSRPLSRPALAPPGSSAHAHASGSWGRSA